MTVTVSMPYFRCAQYVERAVDSVLEQDHRDLRLVLVGDGEPVPIVPEGRVYTYNLPKNRGAYFAHALVVAATPDEWVAPIDSDDWVEPDHISRLLAVGADAVVSGSMWRHEQGKAPYVKRRPRGSHVGLYMTDFLRSFGSYGPGERVGQDDHLLRIMATLGGYARVDHATYHRVRRPGSLTTSEATAPGSPARDQAHEANMLQLAKLRQIGTTAGIREYREARYPLHIREELRMHAARLSEMLG